MHASKVPRLGNEEQTGGAVSTRGTKRSAEDSNPDVKVTKMDSQGKEAKTDGGTGPLFQANIAKMGTPKNGKKAKSLTRNLRLHWITYATQNQTKI